MNESPRIGVLRSSARDSIADVTGVTVGHTTLAHDETQTRVTVIRPCAGDLYRGPVPAAAVVINGFGKTTGLMQLNELGVLESPIALTNTFAVGTIYTAMIRHAVQNNHALGRTARTLNPVVAECNDGWLNDLQQFAVQEAHYAQAFDDASADFAQGSVGAGRGMSCFGLKGGIGSASRDPLFDAAAEATEQAIVNALFAAETVTGYAGHVRRAIRDRLPDWRGVLETTTR